MKKNILKYFFLSIGGVICMLLFIVWTIFPPRDFEINLDTGKLYNHYVYMEMDEHVVAYKRVHTILYVQGECGFWIINLKKKEFKLLNMQLDNADLKSLTQMTHRPENNNELYHTIKLRQERYKDSLTIFNNLDQLSLKERKIYDELQNGKGEGVKIVIPNKNAQGGITDKSEQWGPYQQPLEYMFDEQ
jgi:hypothetical protein